MMEKEIDFLDYGGKHSECIYTEFVGKYLLPRKFKIDKRLLYLSADLRNGIGNKEELPGDAEDAIAAVQFFEYPPAEMACTYRVKQVGHAQFPPCSLCLLRLQSPASIEPPMREAPEYAVAAEASRLAAVGKGKTNL